MAEDVNYASIVFKTKNAPPPQVKKEEDTVYDEVMEQSKTAKETAGTQGLSPDRKSPTPGHQHYQQLTCCLGILCVILLLSIVALCLYFTLRHSSDASELKQLNIHQATLMADIRNLTQSNSVLERNVTALTARNQNLSTDNQELQTQRSKLQEQMQNMETKWNELNVSRAQWAIDNYCLKQQNGRLCKACQEGWEAFQSSCYAFNNAKPSKQQTWEAARDDCRGKNSDLAVIANENEKEFITSQSWTEEGIKGYWIGLSAENGRWKWINGSFLTVGSWIQEPSANHICVTSLQQRRWESVSCSDHNAWVCKKQAISV